MGRQIIKQPDGKFAVWSSVADGIVMYGATRADIEEFFVSEAKRDALDRVRVALDAVEADRPRDIYFQFAMPWADALRKHNRNFPDDRIDKRPAAASGDEKGAARG